MRMKHTPTHTETCTHLPLCHCHTLALITSVTQQHIDRGLYTYMTSYLDQVTDYQSIIHKYRSIDKLLLTNTLNGSSQKYNFLKTLCPSLSCLVNHMSQKERAQTRKEPSDYTLSHQCKGTHKQRQPTQQQVHSGKTHRHPLAFRPSIFPFQKKHHLHTGSLGIPHSEQCRWSSGGVGSRTRRPQWKSCISWKNYQTTCKLPSTSVM
jgi:hypothetical protein